MNFRKIFNSKITFLAIIALLGYLGFCLTRAIIEREQIDVKLASLKQEVSEMEKQQQENEKMKDYLESDEFYQKEARRILSYQKPGEEVVAVIPDKNITEISLSQELDSENSETTVQQPLSNLQKWWQHFFKPGN